MATGSPEWRAMVVERFSRYGAPVWLQRPLTFCPTDLDGSGTLNDIEEVRMLTFNLYTLKLTSSLGMCVSSARCAPHDPKYALQACPGHQLH